MWVSLCVCLCLRMSLSKFLIICHQTSSNLASNDWRHTPIILAVGDHPRASHLITFFESSPPTDTLSAVHSDILSGILCGNSIWRAPLGARRWGPAVPTELCGACGWGPAVPTELWCSRSGSAHLDLELAVEVWQCPLRSGARCWGPAVPT